jgi:hypothetical protein
VIVDALTGWLGLLILVLAASTALAADAVRQRAVVGVGGTGAPSPRSQRPVRWLTLASVLLAALGAAATLLRFVVLT